MNATWKSGANECVPLFSVNIYDVKTGEKCDTNEMNDG